MLEFDEKNTKTQIFFHILIFILVILCLIYLFNANNPIFIKDKENNKELEIQLMNEKPYTDIDSVLDTIFEKKEKKEEKKVEPVIPRNKIGRNQKCPCGSGIKFKHCCLSKLRR